MTAEPPHFTRVRTDWTAADRRGAIRCRLGRQRGQYSVPPGLYAAGRPDEDSPVFVTANYRLGFDILRRDLAGIACWILALDTKGLNVCCASGAGTFGTDEIVTRVQKSRLLEVVRHRTLILPQLGASGTSAEQMERHTGFKVTYGPVRSRDIRPWLAQGQETSADMGVAGFGVLDRLVLIPAEITRSLRWFPAFAFVAVLFAGLGPGGVVLGRAWEGLWPLIALGLGAILSGSLLVPLLLPFIPFRAFSAKGWVLGAAVTAALLHGAGLAAGKDPFFIAACYLFFPAAGAWMALAFTEAMPAAGAGPLTGSAVARAETRLALPFYLAAGALTLAALTLSKLRLWGVL
jgi:CO dehydrogenase/acetyl-CoA synthase delta subunit